MQALGKFAGSMTPAMPMNRPAPARWSPSPLFCLDEAGDAARPVPRRFVPRLAAGFDEDAHDGLREFDRNPFRPLRHAPAVALVLAAVSSFALLAFLVMSG